MLPLSETMWITDAPDLEKMETITNVLWPQGNPVFRDTIQSYSAQLSELDQTIRRMILESLGLDDYLNEHFDSSNYFLRLMKYKGPKTTETKLGLGPHTDKNIVTILYQLNQVDGLEVQTKDGEWMNVTPSKDSFTVFIGDSLYAWTNGRIQAPYHRVMMKGDENRYSVALFSTTKEGYIIKAPEKLIDEQHPLLFKPFDYVKLLEFVYTEAGMKASSPLKAYCGI